MKTSLNDGITWSEVIKLPENMLGPIRNKSIQLSSGEILYPSSTESISRNIWKLHLEISDAHVKNWEKIDIDCDECSVIQPSILVHKGEILEMLLRSKQSRIIQYWSIDEGKTWSKISPTNLPNPNSGIDAKTLKDDSFILISNPLIAGKEWSNDRNILKVAHSKDGINWTDIYAFENKTECEFSYPPSFSQAMDSFILLIPLSEKKLNTLF